MQPELTGHWAGVASVAIFLLAYAAVVGEKRLGLHKSVPVLVGAGAIWVLTGIAYAQHGISGQASDAALHNVLDYAQLFLFVLVALTYVNTVSERGVFDAVRAWLISRDLSMRALFWVTGLLAFLMSPVADNLTTALVLGSIAVSVGQGRPRFISLACINIVVAANAGGVFSPFGDVTTLMVWQSGTVSFTGFFPLAVPALVNWLVPAAIMSLHVDDGKPQPVTESAVLEAGALTVTLLFFVTIALTVSLHSFLHLPSAIGMMFGLGLLKLYSYSLNRGTAPLQIDALEEVFADASDSEVDGERDIEPRAAIRRAPSPKPLRTFELMEKIEWDTLLFFYGVVLAVGGLNALGYLAKVSSLLYGGLGSTMANVLVGLLSAVIDNVPVVFAVLSMGLTMSQGEWLLVTLTAGVGGSLLSVGSAAGVALMGMARANYTFGAHLRWSYVIALGYAASVGTHMLVNRALFEGHP
ncbi:MAG TPA: sodium:proton antiporter NhaD [Chloroflexota bacterium]|nr:sodium:proton antiporter NhaD [Chloroflexota bacterium]